ncbi:TPA: hypothetical protein ACH3X1_016476 [Trebouxia sp. C0004]
MLLDKGADLNRVDKFDWTPLHSAACRNKDIAQLLLDRGANVSVADNNGFTPLHRAAMTGKDVAQLLLDSGADVKATSNYGTSPLHLAAQCNSKDASQLLLDRGANIEAIENSGPHTALHLAAMNNHFATASMLGYLVYPSSKVSAFLQSVLEECTANNSKNSLGAVKSARKALGHLRACQVGKPEEGTEFPSQPYIAGVTSRAKTATAEARQWSVAVCCQA